MTDETQEPEMENANPQDSSISEKEAQEKVDRLPEDMLALAEDKEIIRYCIGKIVFQTEYYRVLLETGHEEIKIDKGTWHREDLERGVAEREREIEFFSQLARDVPLAQAIRTSPRENIGSLAHHCRNASFKFQTTPAAKSKFQSRDLGTVRGATEFTFEEQLELAKKIRKTDEEQLKIDKEELKTARERALERARKLDEELGQK